MSGLAKTLLVQTVANVLDLSFNRIQFTPDLMPSDIIGSEILGEDRNFKFIKGPVFSNIILADEINRTPPKTQAALLEAMQEKSVTAAGVTHHLPKPFFDTRKIGELVARLNDSQRIQRVIKVLASNLVIDILVTLISFSFLFYTTVYYTKFFLFEPSV